MCLIHINTRPPGCAPEEVRDAWIGLEFPCERTERDSGVYYVVSGNDAVTTLRNARRDEAAGIAAYAQEYESNPFNVPASCCTEVGSAETIH